MLDKCVLIYSTIELKLLLVLLYDQGSITDRSQADDEQILNRLVGFVTASNQDFVSMLVSWSGALNITFLKDEVRDTYNMMSRLAKQQKIEHLKFNRAELTA